MEGKLVCRPALPPSLFTQKIMKNVLFLFQIELMFDVQAGGVVEIDNLGPCSLNEVFFPYVSSSNKGIGSCFMLEPEGRVTYNKISDACADSSGRGAIRYSFNR